MRMRCLLDANSWQLVIIMIMLVNVVIIRKVRKMIVYQNEEGTVRVQKRFDDRAGQYCYILEKWVTPCKLWGLTILKGRWHNGAWHKCGIPAVSTYNPEKVDAWIAHYHLLPHDKFHSQCPKIDVTESFEGSYGTDGTPVTQDVRPTLLDDAKYYLDVEVWNPEAEKKFVERE
jgi:hypothetical protein